jgi:hypothetical protein
LLADFAASVVFSVKAPASGCRGVRPVTVFAWHAGLAQVTAAVVPWGDLAVHPSPLPRHVFRVTSFALREASRMAALMVMQTGVNVMNGIKQA